MYSTGRPRIRSGWGRVVWAPQSDIWSGVFACRAADRAPPPKPPPKPPTAAARPARPRGAWASGAFPLVSRRRDITGTPYVLIQQEHAGRTRAPHERNDRTRTHRRHFDATA